MEPEESKPKSLKPLTRWVAVPFAFSWLGFILMAPFALADERFAYGGLIFGGLIGFVIAINDPKWVTTKGEKRQVDAGSGTEPERIDLETPAAEPPKLAYSLLLTTVAGALAGLVVWALQQDVQDKGILFFVAAFFVISLVRRTLRRAWGFVGSLAGMAASGSLLVLVIRSSAEEHQNKQLLTWVVAVPFILVEAWDEMRALKRQSIDTPSQP